MMICHTIRTDKKLQMSNKHDGLLYLVLEPRNEIGGSLSRTGFKKDVNFLLAFSFGASSGRIQLQAFSISYHLWVAEYSVLVYRIN